MLNNYGITPEEMQWRKKRNRYFLYVFFFLLTIAISAGVTILVNNL